MFDQLLSGIRSFFLAPTPPLDNPKERRRLVRVRTHIPVQLKISDRLQSALISDMGVQGMRLRVPFKLKSGSRVPVLHSGGSGIQNLVIQCKVAWCRRLKGEKRFSAGLTYDDAPDVMRKSWVAVILRELGLDHNSIRERREFIRAAGTVPVTLFNPPGSKAPEPPKVETVNVGVGGLLLLSKTIVQSGAPFLVEVGPLQRLHPVRQIEAVALSCQADTGGYLVALRFPDLSAEQVKQLGAYVLELLREAAG